MKKVCCANCGYLNKSGYCPTWDLKPQLDGFCCNFAFSLGDSQFYTPEMGIKQVNQEV